MAVRTLREKIAQNIQRIATPRQFIALEYRSTSGPIFNATTKRTGKLSRIGSTEEATGVKR